MADLNLLKYNRHWQKFKYPFPKKREIFNSLLKTVSKRQITEIIGLRRVGKTTLLFQIINYLLEKRTNPFLIWYFSFDEEQIKLDDLFKEFSKQTQIDFKKEKIYVFLDEIQKLSDFQNQIKVYYDLYPNLKFFLSGSTSLFIKKKTQESLAGRTISFLVLPLNFREYLYFKEKLEILKKPEIFRYEIEKEFEIFLESQFIESLEMKKKEERNQYFVSILRKIIFEDIPLIFPVENPEVLWKIVKIIAQKPGILIDYHNFSKEIGISNKTLSSYLYYLEEAFLVKKIYNFSRNLITSERKLKKFYLSSPSFCFALADFIEKGRLVENFALSLKNYRFFWRDAYKHEVDFVEVQNEKIFPVEIKYKEKILPYELKNLLLFSKKFKTNQAILYTKTLYEKEYKLKDLKIKEKPIFFL